MRSIFPRVVLFLVILIALPVCPFSVQAATYYIAANGSDAHDGLSSATPWQSISKVNSLSKSAAAGSTFLFRRGDIFRGTIKLAGETENAAISAYGTGDNPIISGSVAISGWSLYSGNIYVADVSGIIPAGEVIEQLFVNNQRMLLARYPNVGSYIPDPDEGWLEVGSSSNKHSFTDPVLGTYGKPANYWVGGNVRIRTFSWLFETRTVTSSTTAGGIVLSADLTETLATYIQPGWGYYIDNVFGELDHENEWYFDAATAKVYLYAPGGVDPNTLLVEGAILDYGCDLIWHYHGTTIDGLTFRHQNQDGVNINQSNQVTIRNCLFDNINLSAVNMAWNSTDLVVEHNEIRDILDFGFKFIATTANGGWNPGQTYFRHNYLHNLAVVAGYGGSGVAHACGIRTYGVHGLNIQENLLENIGYVGIHLEGGDHLVEHNIVRRAQLTLDDGGGIFVNSPDNTIHGNIVVDTWGNRGPSSGTNNGGNFDNNQMGMGIFFQPNMSGNVVTGNTFANNSSHGIYPHYAASSTISDNVSYNNGSGAYQGSQLYLAGSNGLSYANLARDNILVAAKSDQLAMRTDTAFSFGTYDNAVLCNLATPSSIRNGSSVLTLPAWQASGAGRDPDATDCPTLTEPVSRILINDTAAAKSFALGTGTFLGADGSIVGSSPVVPAYSSLVIFQEQSFFYSLSKLIDILQVLCGADATTREVLDIGQDGRVGLEDAIELLGLLSE